MGELKLDVFVQITLFVQNCGSYSSKPMPGDPPLVAHVFEPFEDGVVTHRALRIPIAAVLPASCYLTERGLAPGCPVCDRRASILLAA